MVCHNQSDQIWQNLLSLGQNVESIFSIWSRKLIYISTFFTLHNIILNIMLFLFSPALGFIFSSTDLRSLDITILDQGGSAHLDGLIEGNLLVVDEAVLPEVLLALLLLLSQQ